MTSFSIDGSTVVYAVLGSPVKHSLSPAMHNASFASLGLNAVYLAFEVSERDLMPALESMRAMGFGGVNLTIPLKRRAFESISRLDADARRLGAVNTVAFDGEGLRGGNTDGVGFLDDLKETLGIGPRDRRVFTLGCGGAGRAVAIACASNGAAALTLTDLDPDRAGRVAREITAMAPGVAIEVLPPDRDSWSRKARECDLIVQATPVGMRNGEAPLLDAAAFRPGQALYDLVYVAPVTPVMAVARSAGASAANGLGMLMRQGAASFRIWTGREPDVGAMRKALETALDRKSRGG